MEKRLFDWYGEELRNCGSSLCFKFINLNIKKRSSFLPNTNPNYPNSK